MAIEGETFEINEMYPAYIEVAKLQNEASARRSLEWAFETEKEHAKLFSRAKEAVDGGKDLDIKKLYVCKVCGYTHDGDAPDKCPLCGAPKVKIEEFSC